MYIYESCSPEKTMVLAKKLGAKLQGGEILALEGDLGAGKTLFVKGLAEGLGVEGPVTSPTFMLLHLYEGRLLLAHFDVYRLPFPEAFEELGYEDYFSGSGVTVIEWSDLINAYLPAEHLQIKITCSDQPETGDARLITLCPHGQYMETLVKELIEDVGFRN